MTLPHADSLNLPDIGAWLEASREHALELRTLFLDASKQPWFEHCFQASKVEPLPSDWSRLGLLRKLGLVDADNRAAFRVNCLREAVCVTDLTWRFREGVFPH